MVHSHGHSCRQSASTRADLCHHSGVRPPECLAGVGSSVSLLVGLALAAVGVLVGQVTAPGLAIVPVVAGPLGESAPCAVIPVRTWKILGHFLLRYLFMQFPMPFLLWYPAWDLRYRPAFGICVAAFCASVSGPAMLRLGVWPSSLAQWEVGRPPTFAWVCG